MTSQETGTRDVVDMATYRVARRTRRQEANQEVVTEVMLRMTRAGTVVPSHTHVADLHVLAVLAWCLDVSSDMLDSFIRQKH